MTGCVEASCLFVRESILGDAFIRQYLEDLLTNVRTQVLLKLIQPYTRVTLNFVSKKLNISLVDVEQLLVMLILDKRIDGSIDQVMPYAVLFI